MNTLPDYSRFHIHELKARLKALDPQVDQEEIQEIHKWIDKGGYQFPSSNPTDTNQTGYSINRRAIRTKFHSPKFIKWLVALMVVMLLLNFYGLLVMDLRFALIPIAVQSAILYGLYKAHPMTKTLVKIWAGVIFAGGVFGLIAGILSGNFLSDLPIINIAYVVAGTYIWKKSERSMEVIYAEIDSAN